MKMMNKKAAIGLSINTLVIIIISLVILAGGITLLYKFIGGAENIKENLDVRTKEQLERLLVDQGKKVAMPLYIADVERGKTHVFGLGILNTLDQKESFIIQVKLRKVLDESENEITDQVDTEDLLRWVLYNGDPLSIERGDHRAVSILVKVPKDALKGQYIYKATVWHANGGDMVIHGNPQTFFVNVK